MSREAPCTPQMYAVQSPTFNFLYPAIKAVLSLSWQSFLQHYQFQLSVRKVKPFMSEQDKTLLRIA